MLTEEQHKDYNIFKSLLIEVIPGILTDKIIHETDLKDVFLKKLQPLQKEDHGFHSPWYIDKMWNFIYNLDKFILEGPSFVDYTDIPNKQGKDAEEQRKAFKRHYNLHIEDKNRGRGEESYPFFNVKPGDINYDPRDIDFKIIPPIMLNENYTIIDGQHRVFLARLTKNSIKAYRKINKPNNHPNIPKIKSYLI